MFPLNAHDKCGESANKEEPRQSTVMKYTMYAKVCGHHFKLVDLATSATPVADR